MMLTDFQSTLTEKLDMNMFNTLKKNILNVADTLLAIFSGSDPAKIEFDTMDGSFIKNRKEGDGIIYIFFKGIVYSIMNWFFLSWIVFLISLCIEILEDNTARFTGILQKCLGQDGELITGFLSFFFFIISFISIIIQIVFFFKSLGMVYTRINKGKGWPILGAIIYFTTGITLSIIIGFIVDGIRYYLCMMAYESHNFACNIIGLFLVATLLYIIYIELKKSLKKAAESLSKTERFAQAYTKVLLYVSIILNVIAFIFAIGHLFRVSYVITRN
ncbi:hypothetical protein NEIRO02_1450 [Nematocida sp. AWRm79]|nr:hypothetical protein NEIRO02_1450 [Nematocida sp. AWRm79]